MKETTVWRKWECGGGSRWTTVVGIPYSDNLENTICNFSGCGCKTAVHGQGFTDRSGAVAWFRRNAPRHRKA
jgi:hypothetical protein